MTEWASLPRLFKDPTCSNPPTPDVGAVLSSIYKQGRCGRFYRGGHLSCPEGGVSRSQCNTYTSQDFNQKRQHSSFPLLAQGGVSSQITRPRDGIGGDQAEQQKKISASEARELLRGGCGYRVYPCPIRINTPAGSEVPRRSLPRRELGTHDRKQECPRTRTVSGNQGSNDKTLTEMQTFAPLSLPRLRNSIAASHLPQPSAPTAELARSQVSEFSEDSIVGSVQRHAHSDVGQHTDSNHGQGIKEVGRSTRATATDPSTPLQVSLDESSRTSDAFKATEALVAEIPSLSLKPTNAEVKLFLRGLFVEYATAAAKTSTGEPLMNCPDLLAFFRDFTSDMSCAPTASKQELYYLEELELQKDTRFRFDLSRAEASRGLCFETFEILLAKALPNGLALKMVQDLYCQYAGCASRAARL